MNEDTRYKLQMGAAAQVLVGSFFILEHILTYGGTDPTFGHEWLGLILVITGTLTGLFSRKKDSDKLRTLLVM
jgi:hypothetical protein